MLSPPPLWGRDREGFNAKTTCTLMPRPTPRRGRVLPRKGGAVRNGCASELEPVKKSHSSLMLSTMTIDGDDHGKRGQPARRTSAPILRLSAVNITSGTTAKGSCRLSTTWDRIRSLAVPAVAVPDGDDRRRHDGDGAGDQPPQPRRQAECRGSLPSRSARPASPSPSS